MQDLKEFNTSYRRHLAAELPRALRAGEVGDELMRWCETPQALVISSAAGAREAHLPECRSQGGPPRCTRSPLELVSAEVVLECPCLGAEAEVLRRWLGGPQAEEACDIAWNASWCEILERRGPQDLRELHDLCVVSWRNEERRSPTSAAVLERMRGLLGPHARRSGLWRACGRGGDRRAKPVVHEGIDADVLEAGGGSVSGDVLVLTRFGSTRGESVLSAAVWAASTPLTRRGSMELSVLPAHLLLGVEPASAITFWPVEPGAASVGRGEVALALLEGVQDSADESAALGRAWKDAEKVLAA